MSGRLTATGGDTLRAVPNEKPEETRPVRIDMRERNKAIMAEYRANSGRPLDGSTPLVIITTTGAKSGNAHSIPVCVREDGEDLVIAASAGGRAVPPQWYKNLLAQPEVTVEYLGQTYKAAATTVANSLDRNRLFDMMSEVIIGLYGYQDRCRDNRQIPIIRLQRG